MEAHTKLHHAVFRDDGSVEIKLMKRLSHEGRLVFEEPHAMMIPPDWSEAQIAGYLDAVYRHLGDMEIPGLKALASFPPLTAEAQDRVMAMVAMGRSQPRDRTQLTPANLRDIPKRAEPAASVAAAPATGKK